MEEKSTNSRHSSTPPFGICPNTKRPYHARERLYHTHVIENGRERATMGVEVTCSACGDTIANYKRDPNITYI